MDCRRIRILPLLLPLLLLVSLLFCFQLSVKQKHIADSLLRLHIVANSNAQQDQSVKLAVRDLLCTRYGPLFSACQTRKESLSMARRLAPQLQRTATEELRRQGFLYPVTVAISPRSFPTKHYGSLSLPGGRYLAITLRLGAGAGENWWCVMYPPLCLTGNMVQADEKTLARLRTSLTPAEYAMITQPDTISVRMGFKVAELLERFRSGF